ncbi:MAG TPA: retropepsin-like aspartic protease [Kofleriaceae bacterium]
MRHKASLFAAITLSGASVLAGCAGAAPSGFPKGDHWVFPLIGPLEDGLLLTPVSIHGHGPYVFAIDPDANISVIDKQVADEAGLTTGNGPSRFDEAATEQMRAYAELIELKLGNLTIDHRQVMLVPSDFYNTDGRRVNGVLGRDVLAGSLVFGFDRDQGIAMLSTEKAFTPPPDAIAIKSQTVPVDPQAAVPAGGNSPGMNSSSTDDASRIGVITRSSAALDVTALPRRVTAAQIDGAGFTMHLDLGAPVSQLREALWPKAKLTPADVKIRLVDEVATVRDVTRAGIAAEVALGAAKASHVTMAPYADKRFAVGKLDGALGLDFFQPYAVYASWDGNAFYLKPRGDAAATTAARLGRWGADLPTCPHPGCVTASLTSTTGGPRLDVVRDPEAANHALEVRLGVTPAAGKTAEPLTVELPAKVDKLSGGLPPDYDGATTTVLDVSPFTRPCTGDTGCVIKIGAPAAHAGS